MKRFLSLSLILALFLALAAPASAQDSPFGDVPSGHWAFAPIRAAYEEHIISGVGYDQESGAPMFAPEEAVTAAQFAAIVTQAFFWKELDWSSIELWYTPYQRTAEAAGLMEGVAVEDWTAPMSRYQMAQLLYNIALERKLTLPDKAALAQAQEQIADWSQIPESCREAVVAAYAMKLLTGVDSAGSFAGEQILSRAQAAVVYSKLEEAILTADSPMERALEKEERRLAATGLSYQFTRYSGKGGTVYVSSLFGTPHGTSRAMCYVAQDGAQLDILELLPAWFMYGSMYYADPTEIQFDESGEKLTFVTPVQEGEGWYDQPVETKDWGPTRCTVDLTSGTMESMVPVTPQ